MDNLTLYNKLSKESVEFAINIILVLEGIKLYYVPNINSSNEDLIWGLVDFTTSNINSLTVRSNNDGNVVLLLKYRESAYKINNCDNDYPELQLIRNYTLRIDPDNFTTYTIYVMIGEYKIFEYTINSSYEEDVVNLCDKNIERYNKILRKYNLTATYKI